MAGANNRSLKTAGFKAREIQVIRSTGGRGLSLRSAIGHAQSHGITVPAKAVERSKIEAPEGWKAAARGEKAPTREGRVAAMRAARDRALSPGAIQSKMRDAQGRHDRLVRLSDAEYRKSNAAEKRGDFDAAERHEQRAMNLYSRAQAMRETVGKLGRVNQRFQKPAASPPRPTANQPKDGVQAEAQWQARAAFKAAKNAGKSDNEAKRAGLEAIHKFYTGFAKELGRAGRHTEAEAYLDVARRLRV